MSSEPNAVPYLSLPSSHYQTDPYHGDIAFNRVAEVSQVLREIPIIANRVVPDLATLFVRHGLTPHFNIILPHRHFSLHSPSEQVVELSSKTGQVVCSVFRDGLPDKRILDDCDLTMPRNPVLYPTNFVVLGEKLVPYEYSCAEDCELPPIPCPALSEEFFRSWNHVISSNAVAVPMGLALKSRNDIPTLQVCDAEARLDFTECLPTAIPANAFPAEWTVHINADDSISINCLAWCGGPWFCPICQIHVDKNPCPYCGTRK